MSSWKICAPFTGFTWRNLAPCAMRPALCSTRLLFFYFIVWPLNSIFVSTLCGHTIPLYLYIFKNQKNRLILYQNDNIIYI